MGSDSSDDCICFDLQREGFGRYSSSADASESKSGGGGGGCSSSSRATFPLHGNSGLFPAVGGRDVVWELGDGKRGMELSEIELMKGRFAKLLLGEDMSGGGNGVCTALAISNAITNLSASVFGELLRLEPLAPQKKLMWRREMEWLLCVSDSIVELIPSLEEFPGGEGRTFEVMVAQPRLDLDVNLPALKKLDAILLGILDGFKDYEFWYVNQGILPGDADLNVYPPSGRPSARQEEKWWLPCPKVPPKGLSGDSRKRLQQCRDCVNQIFKAAMEINRSVLADMEIPDAYLENLPKNGKSCLGDTIYHYIIADQFSPEGLLNCLDLSSEHCTLVIADRIEAAIHVWNWRDQKTHSPKTKTQRRPWGSKVKALMGCTGKSHLLAQRAESVLQCLRLQYPGLPQTVLDMNKIQNNKDVGKSILEGYSRVLESFAYNIMARIDDLIYVNDITKCCAAAEEKLTETKNSSRSFLIENSPGSSLFLTPTSSPPTPVSGSPGREQLTSP